ncbi:Alpha-L-fucosidase 2 [Rhynchospora pubera]|uniref:Alpha-L-fucosidase 2 n=1 Tax=Rhynchospora pubera TaxID=906938 RepID=A0AAV8HV77_9POAL|nr:Alpha-L-fucosidase 2 [Rhynchospora pubera]
MAKPEQDSDWVWVGTPPEFDTVGPHWPCELDQSDESGVERPLKVVFSQPAKYWTDAAPIGNGRLGAMVWGGVTMEKLQLNHDTLWTGEPGNYTNSSAPAVLSKVRKLVDSGQYSQANAAAFDLSGEHSAIYQPLGDLDLDFTELGESYTSYKRELDLNTACVTVSYSMGDVLYTRQHFSSYPHQSIITKISANKSSSVSFVVSLTSQLHHTVSINSSYQIVLEGTCPSSNETASASDADKKAGIKFSAILDLQVSNGTVKSSDGKTLKVNNADWVVLVLTAASSFAGPFVRPANSKVEPQSVALRTLDKMKGLSYSDICQYHLDDYKNLFQRVTLQLGNAVSAVTASKSTENRIKSFKDDEDPSLVELLFHYGRYLLISSSRPGTQISNLQGIWSKDIAPAWDAAPHLNINLQMNYWPALPCNLSECQEPLFDFISSLSVNGSKTAKVNYEANGWVAHQVTDIWAKTSPDRGDPLWALWPMGGAWLCTHLLEHYSYTLDKSFLENTAYPLLEGSASFLLDWLIMGSNGYLETNPSTSPEHAFIAPDGKNASVSYSTTMDMAIIREMFVSVISAAEILGKSQTDLVAKIKTALPKLPPYKIARDGTVMEWALDFQDSEIHHRHVSHLFGLFPGHTITPEKTPDLCKAVANSLYKRGVEGPGWSTVWKMTLWARLRSSEHAYTMVKHLFDLVDPAHESDYEGGLYSNLFTAHPPFQIDANYGFSAGIAEILVQSTEQELHLLPALPREKWPTGCVKGLKARGMVTVNICWKKGQLHEALVWCNDQNKIERLRYCEQVATVSLLGGKVYRFGADLKCLKTWPLKK